MNCKAEFLEEVGLKNVLCAKICLGGSDDSRVIVLQVGYRKEDYIRFLVYLDFDYDNGFGGQEIFGTIWYEDGTWSERAEYDGSEWWAYRICPEIPPELIMGQK